MKWVIGYSSTEHWYWNLDVNVKNEEQWGYDYKQEMTQTEFLWVNHQQQAMNYNQEL